jgi:penicillin-binding protein 1A
MTKIPAEQARNGPPEMARQKRTRARRTPSPAKGPGPAERASRRLLLGLLRLFWWIGLRTGLAAAAVVAGFTLYFYSRLPPLEDLLDARERGSVTLLDRSGEVFAWRGETYAATRAGSAAPHLINAVVATEDRRFWRHLGISPRGIASAIRINLSEGRGPLEGNGGSTITQQVAKLLCLGRPRGIDETEEAYEAECRRGTLARKLMEVPFALALEAKFSKAEVLSVYLNRSYLGAGARGFEAAARRYFGKSAADVTPAEAAMLAGLLKAPTRYAPTRDLQAAQDRASLIIGLMQDQGYLTEVEASLARANPARLSPAAEARAGGYFADWVMEAGPEFFTSNTTEDVEILTTFDARLQKAAEDALAHVFETKVSAGSQAQAAIVILSPDGAVRAMVGGRNLGQVGQFNRATQALRQPGSAFKPLVYAAGLESGMLPNDLVMDEPVTVVVPGSGPWSPENYTRDFRGLMTLTDAFAQSVNTVAVKVSEHAGRERVRALARDLGITSAIAEGPSLALGVSEVTLLELTGAYAAFLNGGRRSVPYGLMELRLARDQTPLMGADRQNAIPVLNERTAGYMVHMLRQVIETGTGGRARLPDRPAAGKTGTTQAARDAWFIGFTGDYVTGVWMGYDDNTPLKGVTGGGLPAEIWRETMLRVSDSLPPVPLPELVPPPPAYANAGYGQAVAGTPQDPAQGPLDTGIPQPEDTRNIIETVLDGIFGTNY